LSQNAVQDRCSARNGLKTSNPFADRICSFDPKLASSDSWSFQPTASVRLASAALATSCYTVVHGSSNQCALPGCCRETPC
jgi:hypothetical protein